MVVVGCSVVIDSILSSCQDVPAIGSDAAAGPQPAVITTTAAARAAQLRNPRMVSNLPQWAIQPG